MLHLAFNASIEVWNSMSSQSEEPENELSGAAEENADLSVPASAQASPKQLSDDEAEGDSEEDSGDDSGEEADYPEEDTPGLETTEDIANIIQAMIFASPDVVTVRKLRECIGDIVDSRLVKECMQLANDNLNRINSPFEIVEQGGGYIFRTRTRYYAWVRKLFPDHNARKLSQAALETLSIVAYKQPVTKAELESVRGVSSDGPLRSLLEKKLIALGGRSEGPGNPFYYVTTNDFLKYFGINRIQDDLPRLEELSDLISAGELVPQIREGALLRERQEDYDPDQVELPMGDD